jgi:hypothetical protein
MSFIGANEYFPYLYFSGLFVFLILHIGVAP